ncbi:ParA family protein [Thalassospira marina]|uniref:AAA domain-containing protein n=1 Tax=Thalassospira marina TaxID=2048283 RepID=A0A2N3KMJ1_9PROT|nr:ParA family protein [Thalassospira marina]PKR51774.1 hypothetical protein COO20_18140 [Thalassospira marina]
MARYNYDLPSDLIEKVRAKGPMVVATLNEKGGVGKTTLTFQVCVHLAEAGLKVLAVDLDPQGNLTKTTLRYGELQHDRVFDDVDIDRANSMTIFSNDNERVKPLAISDNLALNTGNTNLVALMGIQHDLLLELDEYLARQTDFDIMIIDCPPTPGNHVTAAAMAADFVLSPANADEYSSDAIKNVVKTITRFKRKYNPGLNLLGVILNDVDNSSKIKKDYVELMRGEGAEPDEFYYSIREKVFETRLGKRVAFQESQTVGMPITRYQRGTAADEMYSFLLELVTRLSKEEA